MSTTVFTKQYPSPAIPRRPAESNENTGNGSQRSGNRRSLSVKLRDLFRKDSSASNRPTKNNTNRRSPTAPARQNSSSPRLEQPSTEAPHLRAPTISWPFGKKKTTSTSNTSKTSKTNTKNNRKIKQNSASPIKISSPIYEQDNQTSISGQHFVPRSPQSMRGNNERIQSSPDYQTTTKGFRDYASSPQTQQVIVPDSDVFTPPIYTSDRSRSPSMNRRRSPEYHYRHDNSTSPVSIPLADIDVIPTPQQKRKVDNTSMYTNTQILAQKPPIFPQRSFRASPQMTFRSTQSKNASSSTLNQTSAHLSPASSMEVEAPKLNAPMIPFGSTSSKKKSKKSKSKSRTNGMTGSSTTINNLIQQNPIQPNSPWSRTYGSLPDAEIIHDSTYALLKPSKSSTKTYPGLSAIVRHHLRPTTTYYNEYPSTTATTRAHRPRRFETSTATLDENEQNQPWSQTSIYDSGPITSSNQRHDAYIRPMTPQQLPFIEANITITRMDPDDIYRQPPPPSPQPIHYNRPESPTTYRSSTTVYTRDKHQYVDGGEIRTWSSQDNGVTDDYNNRYQKPYISVEADRTRDHRIVSSLKIQETDRECRYSPRAHEQHGYGQQQKVSKKTDQQIPPAEEEEEEERYEVSFEYEPQQQQQYSYEIPKHYEESHSPDRYSNHSDIGQTAHSSITTERDKIYDQVPRSYEHTQETRYTVAPVRNSEAVLRHCTLRRTDSYDGLGIMISADSQTRLNHFIREVEPHSPGHQAGLRKNDRIISVNDINVENVDFSNVLLLLKQGLDNDNLQISVINEPEHI